MDRDLRRSAYISGFIHVALIIAAIVTLPIQPLATSSDQDVEVDIIGLPPKQSNIKGPGTATAVAPVVHQSDAKSQNAPKPKTIEAPPPPPPPPPPSKAPVSTTQTPQTAPPPPPKPSDVPSTLPPPPPVPPPPHPSTTPQTVKPLAKPPTSLKSATHQPHDVKAPQVMSPAQLAQLLNSHAIKKQVQPPKAVYNPDQDTAPDAGGSPNSTANAGLSGPDREAIAAHMLPCWNYDGEAPNVGSFQVLMIITTDASGTVRNAVVSPQNVGIPGNPLYAAFVQRALYAVQAYQCANLGPYLPSNLLGRNETFTFLYQPGQ